MNIKSSSSHYLSTVAFILGLYCGYYFIKTDTISDNTVQICFTPGNNCTKLIIDTLDQAQENIFIQAYSFTAMPICQAILRAANRGVVVYILLDKSNKEKMSPASQILLNHKNIMIKIDAPSGIAHNKVMIIDKSIVITGSFNFSHAAQHKNAENLLRITSQSIANKYIQNWQKRDMQSFVLSS